MNVNEDSPLKKMLMEHKSIALKYFYGLNEKWNNEVLASAQKDIMAFYQKYVGDRSIYVQQLTKALYALILERYKESILFGKGTCILETMAIHHLVNSNQMYEGLPDFYDRLWNLFAKYANGINGEFTSEGFSQMYDESKEILELDFYMQTDFYTTMVVAVLGFWDENIKLRNSFSVNGVA